MTKGNEIQKNRFNTLLEGLNEGTEHGTSNWMTDSVPASPLDRFPQIIVLRERNPCKRPQQKWSLQVAEIVGLRGWLQEDQLLTPPRPSPPRAASKNDNLLLVLLHSYNHVPNSAQLSKSQLNAEERLVDCYCTT